MAVVWTLDLDYAQQAVLLALADHAHDNGLTHPGVGYLAWKTGYSTRQVQRIVRKLQDDKLLLVDEKAHQHKATVYRLNLLAGTFKKPYVPDSQGRHIDTPDQDPGVTSEAPGVTNDASRGDTAMSSHPSNHQEQPARPRARAAQDPAAREPRKPLPFQEFPEEKLIDPPERSTITFEGSPLNKLWDIMWPFAQKDPFKAIRFTLPNGLNVDAVLGDATAEGTPYAFTGRSVTIWRLEAPQGTDGFKKWLIECETFVKHVFKSRQKDWAGLSKAKPWKCGAQMTWVEKGKRE